MTNIRYDETSSLEVVYDISNDYALDFDIDWYLIEAGFKETQRSNSNITYVFAKTSDKVKFFQVTKFVFDYFNKKLGSNVVKISDEIQSTLVTFHADNDLYNDVLIRGTEIKNKKTHEPNLPSWFKRTLKDFQKESVEHLISVENGANFSVPGSGKTTITYAALSRWIEDGKIDKIMVIGPAASFIPWEEEYESCFGKKPRVLRIRGDYAEILDKLGDSFDLFLLHYQTSNTKRMEIINFLKQYNTALIIDESHNIKNPKLGKWAVSALQLAPYAKRRIVLSGTPMPNDAQDLWNQITFLWPQNFPLGNQTRYNFSVKKRGLNEHYKTILNSLFCRIKKDDLGLPEPKFIPHEIDIGSVQRTIYDVIAAKTLEEIESLEEQSQLHKFRIAKMVRLLQTASNPSLLYEKSTQFDVDHELFGEEFGLPYTKISNDRFIRSLSVYDKIVDYSKMEIPSKMVAAHKIAKDLLNKGEKVIIWTSFLLNMEVFKEQLFKDISPIIINGNISKDPDDEINRDKLINQFKNDPTPQVLIATPASLGESVSLHKNIRGESVCHNAIYLDRNFNGAQFMQSVDRIHRIGMDKNVEVQYHLMIGKKTIDTRIHTRLIEKWTDMTRALNDAFVSNLDFDVYAENQPPEEFNKDYRALVEHLRELKS